MIRLFAGLIVGVVLGTTWVPFQREGREARAQQVRDEHERSWKVTGVGGVFFKAEDPDALEAWYAENLGMEAGPDGTIRFWSTDRGSDDGVYTVWGPFPEDTTYFQPSTKPFMFNFRVRDLDALLGELRARGVPVDERVETYEYGRFAWTIDPEGNRIELWEPTPGWEPKAR